MVPVIGAVPVLVPVNEGTLPVPLAVKPIAVLEFVHANVAPVGVLVKLCEAIVTPLQTAILAGVVIVGRGLTVIVPVAVPTHPNLVYVQV
jgi:hypothetical protein